MVTLIRSPSTSAIIVTTVVTPMTTPSRVSSERSGFAAQRAHRQPDVVPEGDEAAAAHSYRSASTGSSCAARAAGQMPKTRPTARGEEDAPEHGERLHRRREAGDQRDQLGRPEADGGADGSSDRRDQRGLEQELDHDGARRAPSARRMPISRVRSRTVTSMMFMMPMPPTSRVMSPTPTATP